MRDIRRRTRKQYSAEEKIRIVVAGLRGEESIAELCRREGIAESLYYSWSKEFLEAGKKRLAGNTARQPPRRGAADAFQDPTTAPDQLWQTDFTYLKVVGWGWFYLSTILDDYSRYIIAWKLCTTMRADDVTETLKLALQASADARRDVCGGSWPLVLRARAAAGQRHAGMEFVRRHVADQHAAGGLGPRVRCASAPGSAVAPAGAGSGGLAALSCGAGG